MARHIFFYLSIFCILLPVVIPEPTLPTTPSPPQAEPRVEEDPNSEEPPEGYYAFVESPNATPPRVRPPPYQQISSECPEVSESKPHVSANNLCGDLNRGVIPRNPMGQYPNGEPYPFKLIRNHTLRFLSRTLPVLRADDTLPRVAHLPHYSAQQHFNQLEERSKRSVSEDEVPSHALRVEHRAGANVGANIGASVEAEAPRESRKFCDGGGVFCMLYRAINGDSSPTAGVERREDPGTPHTPHAPHSPHPRYEGPPTPCPARVEYATPVFARNFQGVWRYVVQIPYEGYFTQTVEVTRCMQSRCHYLEGGCLSSPRWVSLLVAELHYPPHPPAQPTQPEYQQYIQKRAGASPSGTATGGAPGVSETERPTHCDGHDEMGCYQVRLYYDWFLVPGSCKCWRPDYFAKYVRRRHNNEL